MSNKLFIKGTLILTFTGLCTRLMGFFYRIFLSHSIGAQGVGIYQLTLPIQGILLAVTSSGIQAAISRLCASFTTLKKEQNARNCFLLGSLLSVGLSACFSLFLYINADFFAVSILKEPQTAPLLQILSFSFPLSALHSCTNSFYFARKKTEVPAILQLLEQFARIGSTYLFYLLLCSQKQPVTAVIATQGAFFSELTAAFSSLLFLHHTFRHPSRPVTPKSEGSILQIARGLFSPSLFHQIFQIAVPHSINKLLFTILSGIEMILIPQQLILSGITHSEALTVYGTFTGMALPFILFPATIPNSASVMLMPSIASLQALGCQKRIRYVISRTCETCFLFGACCTMFFLFFGKYLGAFLFQNNTAGLYIRSLSFLCPFLYTNTALESILNGLGKPQVCLFHNAAGICIRIACILFAVPVLGIRGYFYGMLLSQIFLTLLHFIFLNRTKINR